MDLKQRSGFVLVFVHWGNELFPYPRPEERKIAKMLAESGTDIIIGHHPHVVRGMEMFGTCQVFYSIGNYFFSNFNKNLGDNGSDWAPKNRESICVEISFQSGFDPKCKIHAFQQIENKVIIDQKQRSIKSLEKYSKPFHKNLENEYTSWYARKFYQFSKFFIRWEFGIRRLGIKGLLNYITKKIKSFIGFR